jgi:hypothetical protein
MNQESPEAYLPWHQPLRERDESPVRYRSLCPAPSGLYAVAAWWSEHGVEPLEWQPVIVFAVRRDSDEDSDTVVALVQYEDSGELAEVYEAFNGNNQEFLGLYSERERADASLLEALRERADEARQRKIAAEQQMRLEFEEIRAYVKAQAKPVEFAWAMKQAGCKSRRAAWLACTLSAGDPVVAVRLAREKVWTLEGQFSGGAGHARPAECGAG